MRGFMSVFAVTLALMLTGCGGGGSGTASRMPSPGGGTPTSPWQADPSRGITAERMAAGAINIYEMADQRPQFGSTTLSSNGTPAEVVSLTSSAVGVLTIEQGGESRTIRTTFEGRDEGPDAYDIRQVDHSFRFYDSATDTIWVGGSYWITDLNDPTRFNPNDPGNFGGFGGWLSPNSAGVFFDGSRFGSEHRVPDFRGEYVGTAGGLWVYRSKQSPDTVGTVGVWGGDMRLVSENGRISGSITGNNEYVELVNDPAIPVTVSPIPVQDFRATLNPASWERTGVESGYRGSVDFSWTYNNIAERGQGVWGVQSTSGGHDLGGVMAGEGDFDGGNQEFAVMGVIHVGRVGSEYRP